MKKYKNYKKYKYKICGSYQVQDCTGRNSIVQHARHMTRCCNISSCGTECLIWPALQLNPSKQTVPDESLKLETMVGQWARVRRAWCTMPQVVLSSAICPIIWYITASGHTACVMHNAVPTSAVLHLVGTTNLIFTFTYMTSSATKPK